MRVALGSSMSVGSATRTPSPLLPTIQNTDEEEDNEDGRHSLTENGVLRSRSRSTRKAYHLPPLVITSEARIQASPSPTLCVDLKTPVEERASTITPLPSAHDLMMRRGVNKRRVLTPTSLTTLDVPCKLDTNISVSPRRNSFHWDRRPATAFDAALEARDDRASTPPRRLSAANLWNAATTSILGRLGLGPPPPRRASLGPQP